MSSTDRVTVLSLDHPAAAEACTESVDPVFDAVWAEMVDNSPEDAAHDLRLSLVEAVIDSRITLSSTVIEYMRALVEQSLQGVGEEFNDFAVAEIHRIADHQRTTANQRRFVDAFSIKESTMTTAQAGDTGTKYDSGTGSDEDTPLAEQIQAVGVETVAKSIIDESGSSVKDDLSEDPAGTFDPESVGMTPVLSLVEAVTDDDALRLGMLDAVQNACFKTRDGEENPAYISQVWLDGDIGEQRLFAGYVGDDIYVISTMAVADPDSDFVTNVPTHLRRFLTEDAAKEWMRQYRPKPTEAERQAKAAERFEAAALLRKGLTSAATS